MTLDEAKRRWRLAEPALKFVHDRVLDDLRGLFDSRQFGVIARVKSPDSIAEKIESGRIRAWSDIDDLVALSVIVPSIANEAGVLAELRRLYFEVFTKERGGANKSPDVFRFDVTRFVGMLRPVGSADEKDGPYQVKFEIQIRTAFEHAWSVSTHSPAYKPSIVDWRRLRLAAQLKASVEQLDAMVLAYDKLADELPVSAWPEVEAKSLVADFVSELRQSGVIEEVSMPASLGRLADNFVEMITFGRDVRGFGRIVAEIRGAIDEVRRFAGEEGGRCPVSLSVVQWMLLILLRTGYIRSLPASYIAPLSEPDFIHFNDTPRPAALFHWDA